MAKFTRRRLLAGAAPLVAVPVLGKLALDGDAEAAQRTLQGHVHGHAEMGHAAMIGGQAPAVEKVSWSKNTVWLNKAQTTGFKGVREEVWNFHIGGYQVCEKWLKDRKGRTLSKHDIVHYQKIVVALSETIRLMKEIDVVIEQHGGWPGAFQTNEGDVKKAPECRGA